MKLKPGYLVNLSVRERGGITYRREDLGTTREGLREESSWKTERDIADVEEHALAVEVRGKARSLIAGACVQTPFVLMCLTDSFPLFTERKAEAEGLVAAFNAKAAHCQLHLHCTWGTIAESSREAVESLRNDISYMLAELKGAAEAQDVGKLRDLASRCKAAGELLEDSPQSSALQKAVKAARSLAKATAKAVADGADSLEKELADINLAPINAATFLFLGGAAAQGEPVIDHQLTILDALEPEEAEELSGIAASEAQELGHAAIFAAGQEMEAALDSILSPSLAQELADVDADDSNPYAEGADAYAAGQSEKANPYPDATDEHLSFNDGWADAALAADPDLRAVVNGGQPL